MGNDPGGDGLKTPPHHCTSFLPSSQQDLWDESIYCPWSTAFKHAIQLHCLKENSFCCRAEDFSHPTGLRVSLIQRVRDAASGVLTSRLTELKVGLSHSPRRGMQQKEGQVTGGRRITTSVAHSEASQLS